MTTLADIAAAMGVSTATISNALSGKGRMKEETRRQIRDKARAMGYVGAAVNKVRSDQVVILTEELSIPFCVSCVSGINQAAATNGMVCALYDLNILGHGMNLVATPQQLKPHIRRYLDLMPACPAGLIYISQYPRKLPGLLSEIGMPAVAVFCSESGARMSINYDEQQGGNLAVSHLLEGGRRRVAIISGPIDSLSMNDRMYGSQRAFIEHGASFDPSMVRIGDWLETSGASLTRELLCSSDRPDAIFAQNDSMACGALRAARELGLRVPRDLAVVGFDNTDFSQYATPPLSSIAPPFQLMGKVALEQMKQLLVGKIPQNDQIVIPCGIMRRESSEHIEII